jgi:RluA family pseudouridine synthase
MPISRDRILFEDPHFLAVNKLAGELAVRGAGALQKLPLLDFLKKQYPGLRPVNRLDFETSGVMLFARSKDALERAIATPMEKRYRALVAGRLERREGDIRFALPARTQGTIPAHTHYRVLEQFGNSALVEATIATGRHHQIRQHFAKIGHPLALDHVYGDKKFNNVFTQEFGYRRFFLHAASLSFEHPLTHESVSIRAPLPKAFEDLLRRLRILTA